MGNKISLEKVMIGEAALYIGVLRSQQVSKQIHISSFFLYILSIFQKSLIERRSHSGMNCNVSDVPRSEAAGVLIVTMSLSATVTHACKAIRADQPSDFKSISKSLFLSSSQHYFMHRNHLHLPLTQSRLQTFNSSFTLTMTMTTTIFYVVAFFCCRPSR